jgi:hypothetical protein
MPMLAAADTVRLGSIPEAYRGTWAPNASGCKEPAQRIVLSGEDYIGPEASCRSCRSANAQPDWSQLLRPIEMLAKGGDQLIIQ